MTCMTCGAQFEQHRMGRPRRYCTSKCQPSRLIRQRVLDRSRCRKCGDAINEHDRQQRGLRCSACANTERRARYRAAGGHSPAARAYIHAFKKLRRARLRGVAYEFFRPAEIYERDGWHCWLCGRVVPRELRAPHPLSATLDHVVPIARRGPHTRANVRLAHRICNTRRGIQAVRR